jgi:hypothetical protein
MFPPVESQVIFLSKETLIVSVGLRTAEVSYTNQNKTAWKSEVVFFFRTHLAPVVPHTLQKYMLDVYCDILANLD